VRARVQEDPSADTMVTDPGLESTTSRKSADQESTRNCHSYICSSAPHTSDMNTKDVLHLVLFPEKKVN